MPICDVVILARIVTAIGGSSRLRRYAGEEEECGKNAERGRLHFVVEVGDLEEEERDITGKGLDDQRNSTQTRCRKLSVIDCVVWCLSEVKGNAFLAVIN